VVADARVPGCAAAPGSPGGPPIHSAGAVPFQSGQGQPSGPVTTLNPTDVSDRLAKALGVSGERLREAMIATMRTETPGSLPPDPLASIAQQLGVSRKQVCVAFTESGSPNLVIPIGSSESSQPGPLGRGPASGAPAHKRAERGQCPDASDA
jgi:hypothetical protein